VAPQPICNTVGAAQTFRKSARFWNDFPLGLACIAARYDSVPKDGRWPPAGSSSEAHADRPWGPNNPRVATVRTVLSALL
jgi:hypothetical protein